MTFGPLEPKYVSSVDSGNLAGHLIALGNACREFSEAPIVRPQSLAGIEDALELTRESLHALTDERRTQTVTRKQLDHALDGFAALLVPAPTTPAAVAGQLAERARQADGIVDIARALTAERGDGSGTEVLLWAETVRACIRGHERDLEQLMPWASLLAALDAASPDDAVEPLFDPPPSLADLPDRCEAALQILARRRVASYGADRFGHRLVRADRRRRRSFRALGAQRPGLASTPGGAA